MNNKQFLVVGHIGVQPTIIVNTVEQQGIVVVESQPEIKKSLKDLSIPTFKIKSNPMIEEIKGGGQSRRERRKQQRKSKSRS